MDSTSYCSAKIMGKSIRIPNWNKLFYTTLHIACFYQIFWVELKKHKIISYAFMSHETRSITKSWKRKGNWNCKAEKWKKKAKMINCIK